MKRPERWVEAGARIEGRNEAVRSGVESINICRGGPVSDRYVANSAFAQQRIQHSLLSLGEKPRRSFWPRDAFHAVLSVHVAFSDPWRSSDLVGPPCCGPAGSDARFAPLPATVVDRRGHREFIISDAAQSRSETGKPQARGKRAWGQRQRGQGHTTGDGGLLPQSQLKHMLRSVGI